MQKLQFSTQINAPKEKIWNILWDDKTFRDWANNIDPGMSLSGKLEKGAKVRFVGGDPKYGVTSLVENLVPNELVTFRHLADAAEGDKPEREHEWTGGQETYSLSEQNGITTLTIVLDTPPEQVENFKERLPKVLARIKELSESKIAPSGSGIAIGIAMGAALGAAFDNIAMGIAIGVALGAAFEATRAAKK
ncbi:MAG TPA: SRPBCC domain-containing protein [Candidatus Paceibacterota bacterium]